MPTYDFECPNGHVFEVRCSVADREKEHFCPFEVMTHVGECRCQLPGKRVILEAPMLNDPNVRILDYPGSRKHKAGYVHSHGDKPVSKVSVGYGGANNPTTRALHPIVNHVRPDPVRFRKPKAP